MKRISSVYFFPFLNTYKFQYLGRLGGKQFKMYLAFNWFTSLILLFYGRAVFCRTWLEGTYLLVQGFCSALSGGSWKPTSLSVDFCLQTEFFIPISSDENGTTSGAKASANHLAPSSSSTSSRHATQWPTTLLRPPGYGVQAVRPYSDLDSFNRLAVKNWPSFVSLF